MSNGTVIAVGNVVNNAKFFEYGNQLTQYLLKDNKIKSMLDTILEENFQLSGPVTITRSLYSLWIKNSIKYLKNIKTSVKMFFCFLFQKCHLSKPLKELEISKIDSKIQNLGLAETHPSQICLYAGE